MILQLLCSRTERHGEESETHKSKPLVLQMQTGMIPVCLTSVEAEETLVAKHLLGAIEAILVHQLSDKGPRGPLVLHTGLHQVNGVDCRRSRGYANRTHAQIHHLKCIGML